MLTIIRNRRSAARAYNAAGKAYRTAHRRFLLVSHILDNNINQANFRAHGAALAAERAASDAWLEAAISAA